LDKTFVISLLAAVDVFHLFDNRYIKVPHYQEIWGLLQPIEFLYAFPAT
jgi:hypothetical protein